MSLNDIAYGAFGGGLVGLATASAIAELGERGRQRMTSRSGMRAVLTDVRERVLIASLACGSGGPDDLRAGDGLWQRAKAREMLVDHQRLSVYRRRRLHGAALSLFGGLAVRMAEDLPATGKLQVGDARVMAMWMAAAPKHLERDMARAGSLPACQANPSDPKNWAAAARDVERLARAIG